MSNATLSTGPCYAIIIAMCIGLLLSMFACRTQQATEVVQRWEIRDGRFYDGGKWIFLKIAKPLRNFADETQVNQLIADLPMLQGKGYNCFELNCYWHHFDTDGDGVPDKSLAPLNKLVEAVAARGMYPCLTVETYGVGGGSLPASFWKSHPNAAALNAAGKPVVDHEYGFLSAVPSIFSAEYRLATHRYIRELTAGIDHSKLLFFETTVEPQYMGTESLDYSEHARLAYADWLKRNKLDGPAWPEKFPVPDAFRRDPVWNRFRAEGLAEWINSDAAAFREVAGKTALVAVDYLETGGEEMMNRNGNSMAFLTALSSADIVQVNWHWLNGPHTSNMVAYRNVREVMQTTGRKWAISEHMTFNGSDYRPEDAAEILRSTLKNGTRFGWDFVEVGASTRNSFALYNDDWSPKPLMAEVDNHWEAWVREAMTIAPEGARERSQ